MGQPGTAEVFDPNGTPNSQSGDSLGVVELVVGQRHENLGNASRHRLGCGTNTSVMNEGTRLRQEQIKWNVAKVGKAARQPLGNLLGEFRQEDASSFEKLAR